MDPAQNISICHKCIRAHGVTCSRKCACPIDPHSQDIIDHANAGTCPAGHYDNPEFVGVSIPARHWGPPLWRELHARPLACDLSTEATHLREKIAQRLPCGGCKAKFFAWLNAGGPDLTSRPAYFRSLWTFHNQVNEDLHKPAFPFIRAARTYGAAEMFGLPLDHFTEEEMLEYFDRVVVVSLRRRPERLAGFWRRLEAACWPFRRPDVFDAVDGSAVPLPPLWRESPGARGCMQSHRRILEQAVQDKVERLLILEDDAVFVPDFGRRAAAFLAAVPVDWHCLMLGGQLFGGSRRDPIAPGVLRVDECHRTHCYALQGTAIGSLYRCLHGRPTGHCDVLLGGWQREAHPTFAPTPFLVGQDAGESDIARGRFPVRFEDWAHGCGSSGSGSWGSGGSSS
jgi:hypothetical protein